MSTESEKLYNRFSKSKQQQKYIWYSSLIFLLVIFIGLLMFMYNWSKNVVVVKENGQQISSEVQNNADNFKAYVYTHLDNSFKFTNSFDRFTYKKNRAKALFLVDANSLNRIWSIYDKNGVFADVLSKGVIYDAYILPNSISIRGNNEPYRVSFKGIIEVKEDGYITKYLSNCQGDLFYYTANYPENTTGFMLQNYHQITKRYETE